MSGISVRVALRKQRASVSCKKPIDCWPRTNAKWFLAIWLRTTDPRNHSSPGRFLRLNLTDPRRGARDVLQRQSSKSAAWSKTLWMPRGWPAAVPEDRYAAARRPRLPAHARRTLPTGDEVFDEPYRSTIRRPGTGVSNLLTNPSSSPKNPLEQGSRGRTRGVRASASVSLRKCWDVFRPVTQGHLALIAQEDSESVDDGSWKYGGVIQAFSEGLKGQQSSRCRSPSRPWPAATRRQRPRRAPASFARGRQPRRRQT